MASWRRLCCSESFRVLNVKFSTSSPASNKWRIQKGLERESRQYGPLTNLPDYSFLDGRPVPLSLTKTKKVLHQQELCKRIVELTNELDVGLEQHYQRKEQEKKDKEIIIKNKLKPKGAALLAGNRKSLESDS